MIIIEKLKQIYSFLRNKRHLKQFRNFCIFQKSTLLLEEAQIINFQNDPEKISFGSCTAIRGEILVYPNGGEISIGDWCYVGVGSRVWSMKSVHIGNNVLIAHNVDIHDCNDHPIDHKQRHEHYKQIITHGHPRILETVESEAIEIEDNVWICYGASIGKGVHIGKASIVANHAVVVSDVPAYCIVAGNPAKVIKRIAVEE